MTSPGVTWLHDRDAEATLADMLAGPLRALGFTRPAFPSSGTMALLALMQEAGRELGITLRGIPTGGGSDGNHASGIAPTINGLGPQGSFAHNPDEYIELPTLIERARVNARFIELWAERFEAPPAR